MKRKLKILLPTDFTKDAVQAYTYALEIAQKTGAQLHLFHAIEEPYDFATRIEEEVEREKNKAYAKFQEMMEEARESEHYSELPIYSEIKRGKPLPTILNKAQELKADLIILGTKGESSIKRILYGNVTSSIILESQTSVFTVPANSKKPFLDRFIFATDYRDQDLSALKKTIHFAHYFDAEVHIVHISTSERMKPQIKFRGFCDLVNETFDYPHLKFKRIVADSFSQGISSYLKEQPVSLLVITRYKKKYLKTILWANTTQELTYHTHVPMLVQLPN